VYAAAGLLPQVSAQMFSWQGDHFVLVKSTSLGGMWAKIRWDRVGGEELYRGGNCLSLPTE
jgi:hypothetical protein